uniref:uncharacterized protein LOC105353166 n=1 Tax=Fragaria vesca subsp. vesca TaxID=101020 RepID=UPI0005C9165C
MSDKEIRIPGLTDAAFKNLTERLQRIKRGEPSQILNLPVQTPNTCRQLEFESEAKLDEEEEAHARSIVSSQPSDSQEDIPPMDQQTIRQLSNSVVPRAGGNAPSCITYPEPAANKEGEFELKSGFLHQIPKFHGLSNEDPNKHLKSFQFVCVSMCPRNADINILKLKAFPFSLEDRAKSWLIDLPAGHIDSWEKMMRVGYNADGTYVSKAELEEIWDDVVLETVAALEGLPSSSNLILSLPISTNKLLPSVEQPPKLELKALPNHLKYVYLGANETLPAIVSSKLDEEQEKRLVEVLKKYKTAIGWILADIKGISPTTCVHRILLEDGAKPTREAQRRLHQPMMKVVQDEVIKLLDCGVIYPISDSKWVSPVQVVPKKSGVTVVKNAENELVPQRVVTGHRVCIDYRKLNATTRKDHFPLPFIDQMLERLAGHEFYCFLDGYSGYNQICIAQEDQEKTTFTCPFGTFAYRRMPFGLCNALGTFQRCMMSIFSDYIENIIEVFMDDFSVFGKD